MIEFLIGRPGQGKSIYMARKTLELIHRARSIKKKYGFVRKIYSNLRYSKEFEDANADLLVYWTNPMELTVIKDCDIIWDEIAVELPADGWTNTHREIRRLLAQHRKRGIEIYANTQAYKGVDINFRRMVERLYTVRKLIGNRNPSATLPPVRTIWGIILIRELDPIETEEKLEMKPISIIPDFLWISKKLVSIYDTSQDIKKSDAPPFVHDERYCYNPGCRFKKVIHT